MKNVKIPLFALAALLLLSALPAGCAAPAPAVTAHPEPAVTSARVDAAASPSSPGASTDLMQQLWQENQPFYQKIYDHPYNQELLSGKLDPAVFREFIIQDYHFCRSYKQAHGILLSKAPDEEGSRLIAGVISDIDAEVAALHTVCIGKYNISAQELADPPAYPSTELYNSWLIKTATLEPFEVGLMATIPCHWVYFQVGTGMKKAEKVQDNRYQAWIDAYGSDSWENSGVKPVVDLAEKYMQAADAEKRLKMKQAFNTALKLEYMFWDGVYNRARWVE